MPLGVNLMSGFLSWMKVDERKERKREYWALTCGTSMLDIKQEFINKSLKHKNEERKILMRGNVKRNQQAVTKDLTSSSKFSGSCVLTLQTIR